MYNHQTRPPANPHPEEKKGLLCGHCVALVTSDHSKTACVLGSTPLGWWIELSSSEVVHSRQRIAQEQSRAPVNVHLNVRGQCGTRVGWWAPVGACWKSLCITFSAKKKLPRRLLLHHLRGNNINENLSRWPHTRLTDFSAIPLLTTDLGRRTAKMTQATAFVFNFCDWIRMISGFQSNVSNYPIGRIVWRLSGSRGQVLWQPREIAI